MVRLIATLWMLMSLLNDGGDGGGGGGGGSGGDGGGGDGGGSGDLGDAGKRALDAERTARSEADKARKAAEKALEAANAKLAEVDDANRSESEKALAKARKEAAAEATAAIVAKTNARLLSAEVRAAAGGKLADPNDAVRLIDLDEFEVGDDGDIDRKPIDAAIVKLLEAKPYLGVDGHKPAGDIDQGARGGGNGDTDVTPGIGRLRRAYSTTK